MYSHLAHHTENELGQPPKQPVRPHLQQQKPLLTSTQQNTVALPAILSVMHGLYRNCQNPRPGPAGKHFFLIFSSLPRGARILPCVSGIMAIALDMTCG